VRARSVGFDAQRDDVRVFEEEEQVGHSVRASLLDQRALQLAGLGIWKHAETPHIESTHDLDLTGFVGS
jgi:hypothetical protein